MLAAPAWSQVRSGPAWSELSPADKQLLAPLQQDWDKWDLLRKNKWIAMSKRYPTLPAAEQERIRDRMGGWAKLSTQERQSAREKFKGLEKLPAERTRTITGAYSSERAKSPRSMPSFWAATFRTMRSSTMDSKIG